MLTIRRLFSFFLILGFCIPLYADVLINEIHYNPSDIELESGSWREFIEIHNTSDEPLDISGYSFRNGIDFVFPSKTRIAGNAYVVIARNPNHRMWRNKNTNLFGPYQRKLANGGERLVLLRSDGTVADEVQYNDRPPWPLGADGYNSSLERINPELDGNDYHSWRSSLPIDGTPGEKNSVVDVPPYPMITSLTLNPTQPSSKDSVNIRAGFDDPTSIESVHLRWEHTGELSNTLITSDGVWRYHRGVSSPSPDLEWTELDFDDRRWQRGLGGFGYGDTEHINTILEDMRNNYSTVFIRKTFSIDDPSKYGLLTLNIYVDDGFVCYINGNEVARFLAPNTTTHQSTSTGSHESNERSIFVLGNAENSLQAGENVIALVGLNTSLTSSDLVLAPMLTYQTTSSLLLMKKIHSSITQALYEAVLPPVTSQSFVRFRFDIQLTDGSSISLPFKTEPVPYLSYFVYDHEIESLLPILWKMSPVSTRLLQKSKHFSAAALKHPDKNVVQTFDGALVYPAKTGEKIKFIKGNEFEGDRTINVIPENPPRGTNAGESAPFREHLGFWLYHEHNVLSPWASFYRVVSLPLSLNERSTQRLVVQQVNERMLEMNGRDPDGDLYKKQYTQPVWEKHTNKDEGNDSLQDLLQALSVRNKQERRTAMESRLNLDAFIRYSVASVLQSNWDGFWNNNWMYLDPNPEGKWEIIPWDLDWSWGSTTGAMYAEMPTTFPIDGEAVGAPQASRPPGPVTALLHQDDVFHHRYLLDLRRALSQSFSENNLFSTIHTTQQRLLDDLQLMEDYEHQSLNQRRQIIQRSYNDIKTFIRERREYMDRVLPVPVADWPLY